MAIEKLTKTYQKLIKLRVDEKSPRIVFASKDSDKILDLILSNKKEPKTANLIKSYVVMIQQYIEGLKTNEQEQWLPLLNDLKNFFERESKTDNLKPEYLHKYVWAFRKEFKLSESGELIKTCSLPLHSATEYDIPLIFLRYILLSFVSENGRRVLQSIMVCKVCNKIYANRRKKTCSTDCNVKIQNRTKSNNQYFSDYNRKSDNQSQKKIK